MGKELSEHLGAFIESPAPAGDLDMVTDNLQPGQLFALEDPNQPRPPQPADIPESITIPTPEAARGSADYPRDVIYALRKTAKAFNMVGRNAGRDTIKQTGGNRIQTRYIAQPGNHPDSMTGWTDGKENGLLVGVGLAKSNIPEDKKTAQDRKREADGHKVLETLHGTATRLAAGEPKDEVEASRERFAELLKGELKHGAERQVDAGDRSIPVKVDANYRNSLYKDPEKGMLFLSNLRLRSK